MRLSWIIVTLSFVCLIAHAEPTINPDQTFNKKLIIAANAPPGLQKKGIVTNPSSLGTTPPGWNKGLKKGWNKNPDWHWNQKTKRWENKDKQWDKATNTQKKSKKWNHPGKRK